MAVYISQFDHILNSPNTDLRINWNVILFIFDFYPLTNKFVDENLIQTDCKVFFNFLNFLGYIFCVFLRSDVSIGWRNAREMSISTQI